MVSFIYLFLACPPALLLDVDISDVFVVELHGRNFFLVTKSHDTRI